MPPTMNIVPTTALKNIIAVINISQFLITRPSVGFMSRRPEPLIHWISGSAMTSVETSRMLSKSICMFLSNSPRCPAAVHHEVFSCDISREIAGEVGDGTFEVFFRAHAPQRRARDVSFDECARLIAEYAAWANAIHAYVRRKDGRQPACELDEPALANCVGCGIAHLRAFVQAKIRPRYTIYGADIDDGAFAMFAQHGGEYLAEVENGGEVDFQGPTPGVHTLFLQRR